MKLHGQKNIGKIYHDTNKYLRMGKFVILKKAPSNYFFVLKHDSNKKILQSELYSTKNSCLKGIHSVQKNSLDLNNFVVKVAKSGEYYFIVKARNGEVVGFSRLYSSNQEVQNGIQIVHSIANNSYIVDKAI